VSEDAEPSAPASQAWTELLGLYRDEAGETTLQDRLLGLWAREHGAALVRGEGRCLAVLRSRLCLLARRRDDDALLSELRPGA
jgi:hypothetical protein